MCKLWSITFIKAKVYECNIKRIYSTSKLPKREFRVIVLIPYLDKHTLLRMFVPYFSICALCKTIVFTTLVTTYFFRLNEHYIEGGVYNISLDEYNGNIVDVRSTLINNPDNQYIREFKEFFLSKDISNI